MVGTNQDFLNGAPGFVAGGSDSFIAGGVDPFASGLGAGYENGGMGLVGSTGGFETGSRYDQNLIGDYNSFQDNGNGFGTGVNDAGGFMDFGMGVGGQVEGNGRYAVVGGSRGYMETGGVGYRSMDGAAGGGYVSPGGSNWMVPEYGRSMRIHDTGSTGRGYDDQGYISPKLRGFKPGKPYQDTIGAGVGSGPVMQPRSRGMSVGRKDRVIGVKPGMTTHHSKLTTIVRPIVRPIIRPVVRPIIQRVRHFVCFMLSFTVNIRKCSCTFLSTV